MRIGVIAPGAVPAAVGGAERLYDGLVRAFNELTPHTGELVTIPSPEHSFRQLVDSYDAFRTLDVGQFDVVVSTKYPSWMVRHDRHVVYMLHTLRGLYDTYHYTGYPTRVMSQEPEVRALVDLLHRIPPGTTNGAERILSTARWVIDSLGDDHPACVFPGPLVRNVVQWLDRDALDPSRIRSYYAISRRVIEREDYFPAGVRAESLPPPTTLEGLGPGPYEAFFTASRLDAPKRIDLLIAAVQRSATKVPLRIAGTGPDEQRLRSLAGDDDRIVFLGRISEDDLRSEYSRALAVPFVPLDEDFGLVTVEAQLAAKPVVTCRDSGGVTELVENERTGLVVDPDPDAIARAFDQLAADPERARAMGTAGAEAVRRITWQAVTSSIIDGAARPVHTRSDRATTTSPASRVARFTRGRDRVVVLSTYPAAPARGGGQIRLNRLVCGLSRRFDVELVTLDDAGGTPGVNQIADGARQIVIEKGEEHRQLEAALAVRSPIPIGDLSASLFVHHTPAYIDALREAASGAAIAILEQPYLLPALLRAAPGLPFVYGSQNAETAMKAEILSDSPIGPAFVAVVEAVERAAVQSAALVATCSVEDRHRLEQGMPTLAPWTLVPNGADVFETVFCTGDERRTRRAAFVDALNHRTGASFDRLAIFVASYHPPNLEAAETIVRMATQLPQTAFLLIGSHSDHFLSWRLPNNVLPAGVVSDRSLRELLLAADVALNPMQSGGGTNLKLIEYFASGVPVVSSALGARGVDVSDKTHLLLAESHDELINAVRQVYADAEGSWARAKRARAFVEQRYDWSTIAASFSDDIQEAINRAANAA